MRLSQATERRLASWSGSYQGRLFNTLLHVVGSREEAEDVSPGGVCPGVREIGLVQRSQCVLHLAVPDRVQRVGQPAAAQAVGGFDGPAPGAHG